MINDEQGKHVYFALDSDALSNIAQLYKVQSEIPSDLPKRIRVEKIKEILLNDPKMTNTYKNLKFYSKILSMAQEDKIRLLVTPSPMYESKHIYGVMQFIMDCCYVPKITTETAKEDAIKIRNLAQAYCNPYINKKGEKCKAPLSPRYDAHVKYLSLDNKSSGVPLVPSNDAYVLAEATYYGACLITENAKDFLFKAYNQQGKSYPEYENDRVKGIVEINQKYGYFQPNTTKFFGAKGNIVPRPYSVEGIGKILAYHEETALFSTSEDEIFGPADKEISFY